MRKICTVEGCDARHEARGLCSRHYQRMRRHGDPLHEPPAPIERFRSWIEPEPTSGCWLWVGTVSRSGYAEFMSPSASRLAHRFSYEHFVGPIPEGLQLDHLCRVRCCVNPAHLEPVTQQENIRRGDAGKFYADKTHCPRGHPYSGPNLYVNPSGRRECRECMRRRGRINQRNYLARLRAKKRRTATGSLAAVWIAVLLASASFAETSREWCFRVYGQHPTEFTDCVKMQEIHKEMYEDRANRLASLGRIAAQAVRQCDREVPQYVRANACLDVVARRYDR